MDRIDRNHIPTHNANVPLSAHDVENFHRLGVLRLAGAINSVRTERCQDLLWQELHDLARVDQKRSETWSSVDNMLLKPLAQREEFRFRNSDSVSAALDAILGSSREKPSEPRGRFLASPPYNRTIEPADWHLPTGRGTWHWDGRPDLHEWGIWVFTLVMPLPARSGGTLLLTGTNRLLMNMFAAQSPRELAAPSKQQRDRFRKRHPWFAALRAQRPLPPVDELVLLETGLEAEGEHVQAVDVSGEAGDVILMAGWTIHSGPPWVGPAGRFVHAS
jgi:hypothetical protein